MVRSSGEPTYFASDIAYHYNKFAERGFDRVIDIWGADHQGHVPRMKAAVQALGIEPENLTVLISQMVTLKRGDETVRASKRTGDFVTLRELVDEVGTDACRYFFLARAPSTQMEFDLELATRESSENPVYYVQYAHARNASILNLAHERGIDYSQGDVSLLTHPNELELIRTMLRLPELIVQVAENLEPHHLPHYAMELATAFHHFYENCRVISANPGRQRVDPRPPQIGFSRPGRIPPHSHLDGHVRAGSYGPGITRSSDKERDRNAAGYPENAPAFAGSRLSRTSRPTPSPKRSPTSSRVNWQPKPTCGNCETKWQTGSARFRVK